MDDGTRGLDPVTLAVLQGRLEQIVDEMDATLYRSAFNPTIAEAHDACHGIYHAQTGDTLVQGTSGLPIFVGSMSFAVRLAIQRAARDGGPRDGDVYVFNDPYAGATHLNDFKLVRPLFRDGRVFCWLASVGHFNDVGGNVPGNYNPAARESHQEGVLLPPVKLVDGGVMREDIVDIIRAIGRAPDNAYGDLRAQLSALALGARRLEVLLDEYGDAVVARALDMLTERRSARCVRPSPGWPTASTAARITSTTTASRTADQRRGRGHRRRRPPAPRFHRHRAGMRGPGEHLARDDDRRLLRRPQAHVPGGAGQRRLPGPSKSRARRLPAGRRLAAAGRRLHGDDPAHHGGALRGGRPGRPRARDGQVLWHDQRTVDRRPARRRWQRWVMFTFFGGGLGGSVERRRAEPRQRAAVDGGDPARGDLRGDLPGSLLPVGAAS